MFHNLMFLLYLCRREQRAVPPWIFAHDTANVFFNKYLFYENILTLTNHLRSLLCRLSLRGRGY